MAPKPKKLDKTFIYPTDLPTKYALDVVEGRIAAGYPVRMSCERHLRDLQEGPKRGLRWDVAEVNKTMGFFRDVLRLNGGEFEGRPFELLPWQSFMVCSIFAWKKADGYRRFNTAFTLTGKGSGKALALDTPIPTPSGWTTMGELKEGDEVFDENGKPCLVIQAHDVQYGRPCYELEFDDGATIVADESHLWRTRFRGDASRDIWTTKTIAQTLEMRHYVDSRMIVACDTVLSVPVRCISVSSPSQMYLCGRELIPTHNSPTAAGIGLKGLIADNEPRAEIYAAATKKDQAMILFRDAVAMVRQSPALSKIIRSSGTGDRTWNLFCAGTGGFFRAISSDDGQSGPRPHIVLFDEVHELKDRTILEKLSAGTKGRRQPLIFMITNSGDRRASVCHDYMEYSVKVAEGSITDDASESFFSYICALDEGDDPFEDKTCWIKANPSLGATIRDDYLEKQVAMAKGMPSKEGVVRQLNFCQWVSISERAIKYDKWAKGGAPINAKSLYGRRCYAGLDLAAVRDLTSLALLFPPITPGETWKVLWWNWIPEANLPERISHDQVAYDAWVKAGLLYTTPGDTTDFDFVLRDLVEISELFKIQEIAVDRMFAQGGSPLVNKMVEEGFVVVDAGKGWMTMTPAWFEFERLYMSEQLQHGNNELVNWTATNLVLKKDPAGNVIPDKAESTGRIDPLVALLMAFSRANKEIVQRAMASVYETRGLTVVDEPKVSPAPEVIQEQPKTQPFMPWSGNW